MTRQVVISKYISSLIFSLLLVLPIQAQHKKVEKEEAPDSVAFFNGIAVGVDIAGFAQGLLSDYGQYEAALRINLRDRYFPVLELGIGHASHDDIVTQLSYVTKAPYGRIGVDYNLMKDKHDIYRIYGGIRYAFTSFKFDVSHPGLKDPFWGGVSPYGAEGVSSYYHWAEISGGIDAKIWGPIRLGWSVRYRKRIAHDPSYVGNVWYVPGFGKTGSIRIGYNFMLTIEI